MTNSIRDVSEESQCIFIIGSNTTEQHPVIGTKIRRAKRHRGAKLIVADPRRIDIAEYADLFLRHKPGTDIALLNGIMHVIIREGWQDEDFIARAMEVANRACFPVEKTWTKPAELPDGIRFSARRGVPGGYYIGIRNENNEAIDHDFEIDGQHCSGRIEPGCVRAWFCEHADSPMETIHF